MGLGSAAGEFIGKAGKKLEGKAITKGLNKSRAMRDFGDAVLDSNAESKIGKFFQEKGREGAKNYQIKNMKHRGLDVATPGNMGNISHEELKAMNYDLNGVRSGNSKARSLKAAQSKYGAITEGNELEFGKWQKAKNPRDNKPYVIKKASGSASDVAKESSEKIGSGIGKNSFIGGAVGAIGGAGVGGITAMATGADEDDTKGMIVMGALAGGFSGAVVGGVSKAVRNNSATGSFFTDATKIAGEMAGNGGKNLPVGGGANGLFDKASAKVQSISDKIDNIGDDVSRKISLNAGTKAENQWTEDMLKKGYSQRDLLNDGTVMGNAFNNDRNAAVYDALEGVRKKANTIGGAAQGAIMGGAGGALVGGVAGGIDEDETFLGGALRGGLIGGALGGIGGGISGYANNSAKLLSNTTKNVNSLFE